MIDLAHDDVEMLKALPLCSALSSEDLQAVLHESGPKTLEPGHVLFAEGDIAESAYFVLSGTIEVYLNRDTPIPLAELGRGRIIGEQALRPAGSGRRSASARVLTPGLALEIPAATFQARILSYESNRRALDRAATEQLYDRLVSSLASFHALQAPAGMSQISRRTFRPGEAVILCGGPADAAYFVLSGYARATRPSPDGSEQVIARIGPGQCFGELALIESQPRAATVAAEGALEVLRVESELFLRWHREQPQLRDLLKTLRQMYRLEGESTIMVHWGTYQGSPSVTSLRQQPDGSCLLATQVLGKDIFSLSFSRGKDVGPTEIVEYAAADRPVRRLLYHKEGRLTGVVAQGIGPDVGTLYELVAQQAEITPVDLARFRWTGVLRDSRQEARTDIVCICCNVGKCELFDAATREPRTWEFIQNATGAGLICGSCELPIRTLLAEAHKRASALADSEMRAARARSLKLSIVPTWALDHIPGDDGLPIMGHGLAFYFDTFRLIREKAARYGPVFRINYLGERWVFVGAPDGAREVLIDSKWNFSNRLGWNKLLGKLLAGGLLLRDFDDHQHRRRILEQVFRHEALAHYLTTAIKHFGAGVDRWSVGKPFAFLPAMRELNVKLAAQILLGDPPGADADRLYESMATFAPAASAFIKKEVPGLSFWRGMQGRRFERLSLTPRIAERRGSYSGDMLTQLCNATDEDGRPVSDQDIADQVSLVLLAADEAMTCGLTSVIWMLTCYPEWQEKLRQESREVGAETFDYTETERLPLTSCFVRETFRRYPPVPVILRRSIGGCTILGWEIPPNTQIVICPVLLHHHADYWTEPEHFDPERFLDARAEDARHSHSFIPFGGGAHRCIGMHLALLEIKAFLLQLLSRYRIRLKPKERVKMTMVPFTRPKGGLPVILERLWINK